MGFLTSQNLVLANHCPKLGLPVYWEIILPFGASCVLLILSGSKGLVSVSHRTDCNYSVNLLFQVTLIGRALFFLPIFSQLKYVKLLSKIQIFDFRKTFVRSYGTNINGVINNQTKQSLVVSRIMKL